MKRMRGYLALLGSFALLLVCWQVNADKLPDEVKNLEPSLKIIGGSDASFGEFPHFVSLSYMNSSGHHIRICGGTILDRYRILTAAHCLMFENEIPNNETFHAMPLRKTTYPTQEDIEMYGIKVDKKCPSPLYYSEGLLSHDFAILKLAQPLNFSDVTYSANLPDREVAPTDEGWVSGFGSTCRDPIILRPKRLKKLAVRRTPCRDLISDHYSKICFDPKNIVEGTGLGDSGGGVLVGDNGHHTVVGIVSHGAFLQNDVYANVYNLRDQILELMDEC